MAALTTAIAAIGTAAAVKSAYDTKKAQKSAAAEQSRAAAESAQLLSEAGTAAQQDLETARQQVRPEIQAGMREASAQIEPYTAATTGYDVAKDLLLRGAPASGPLADLIRRASMTGAAGVPVDTSSDPMRRLIEQQSGIDVSRLTPDITQALMTQGTQGISALGDVAAIRQRALESLGELESGTAGAKASTLIGQVPQLQQFAQSAQEARLIGDVAGQQFTSRAGESLARLAGRVV